MDSLLELLGKGLSPLVDFVLPQNQILTNEDVHLLKTTLKDEPLHLANKLRLGIHYAQSGSTEKAAASFRELSAKHPHHIDTYLAWAAMHSSLGELDEAITPLQQAREKNPKDGRVCFGLGYCLEQQSKMEEARKFYREGLDCSAVLPQIRQRLAAIALEQQDYATAIEHCRTLQQQHPEDVWTYMVLGQLYLMTQQIEQAMASFERALTIEPDNFEMYDDQVETLAQDGQITEAIDRLQEIVEKQGEFPDSFVRLGDLYSQIGDDSTAVQNYQRALQLHPGYLEAAVKLGTQHLRMGRHHKAAKRFNKAIEINDRLISGYVGLGVAQHDAGKTDQAEDTLDLAATLQPNTNLLFAEVCRLQRKIAQNHNESVGFDSPAIVAQIDKDESNDLLNLQMEKFKNALRAEPNHAQRHHQYGILLWGKGETHRAIEHFERASSIHPSYFNARIKLGLALREKGKKQQAMKHLIGIWHPQHDSIDFHYKLALTYCDKIRFALTMECLENQHAGKDGEILYTSNLDLALQNMALVDRALATWRSLCELDPQSTMAFQAQRTVMHLNPYIL